jgi:hypothetical protein
VAGRCRGIGPFAKRLLARSFRISCVEELGAHERRRMVVARLHIAVGGEGHVGTGVSESRLRGLDWDARLQQCRGV